MSRSVPRAVALAGTLALSITNIAEQAPTRRGVPTFGYRVVRSYPHDPAAFTQGLSYVDGVLYEGTGLAGQSSLRKVRLETGEVLQIHRLDAQYFGEGI